MLKSIALVGVYAAVGLLLLSKSGVGVATGLVSVVLAAVLIAASLVDLSSMRLPDRLTIPLAVAGIVRAGWSTGEVPAAEIAGVVVGYATLFTVARVFQWRRGYPGLGLGDAKLFAAGGGWVGVWALPHVMLIASVLGLAAVFVARLAGSTVTRDTRIAFGPFLALAIWVVWIALTARLMT